MNTTECSCGHLECQHRPSGECVHCGTACMPPELVGAPLDDAPYVIRCADGEHFWPANHSTGDTCDCGGFYIQHGADGSLTVQHYEDNGDDPRE
jgi:hypothetical protein